MRRIFLNLGLDRQSFFTLLFFAFDTVLWTGEGQNICQSQTQGNSSEFHQLFSIPFLNGIYNKKISAACFFSEPDILLFFSLSFIAQI